MKSSVVITRCVSNYPAAMPREASVIVSVSVEILQMGAIVG